MDSLLSSKDAARSKWRHSQRHDPSRGRGRGGRRNEGRSRGERGLDLGTNADRYLSEDDEASDGEHAGTSCRGADLAEWLQQRQRQTDLSFHPRHRSVNIDPKYEESWRWGGGEYAKQSEPSDPMALGLNLDLNVLAAGLSSLPVHEYLRLPDMMRDKNVEAKVKEGKQQVQVQVQEKKEGEINEPLWVDEVPTHAPSVGLDKGKQMDMLDQELDSLLTLSEKPQFFEEGKGDKDSRKGQRSSLQGGGEQSLEDWLDSL